MIHRDRMDGKLARAIDLALRDLRDLDLERRGGGALFMSDALGELRLPKCHQPVDEAARARRTEDLLRPVAALMPARGHKLEQVHDVIGVEMGQEYRVECAAARARGHQALGRARSAVN